MKINLLAVGTNLPAWANNAYHDFAKRLSSQPSLHLKEIPVKKRSKNSNIEKLCQAEGDALIAAIPAGDYVVALDERGQAWSSQTLSEKLVSWEFQGQNISLLIGGPDGLSPRVKARADQLWSLSPLTLPHALVRVVVAEQLYRADCIRRSHPYHRE